MSSSDPLLSDVLGTLLRTQTGELSSTPEHAVELVKRLHGKLLEVIAPIMGSLAFDALFARTLKKTARSFPALQKTENSGPASSELTKFCERLKAQDSISIEPLIESMLGSFVALLTTFIGEALTWKLIRSAWPDVLPSETPVGKKS